MNLINYILSKVVVNILFYKNITREVGSSWQSRRTLSSPPPTNTSKLQLHIEKLTVNNLKTSRIALLQPRL